MDTDLANLTSWPRVSAAAREMPSQYLPARLKSSPLVGTAPMRVLLIAACIALPSSPAWPECDTTVDALAAQAQLEVDKDHQITAAPLGQSEVNEIYSRYDQAVSASVARCRRGDVISIPSLYVQRFCNFGKKIVYNGDMATCVKR
jgi:hypothetical protein